MKKFLYVLCLVYMSMGCDTGFPRKNITIILDIIPWGDRIHFSMNIRKGMDIEKITEFYGEPRYIFFKDADHRLLLTDNVTHEQSVIANDIEKDKYTIRIKGYDAASFPISNKIYVYFGGFDAIAYVYVDASNEVEHIYIGGS